MPNSTLTPGTLVTNGYSVGVVVGPDRYNASKLEVRPRGVAPRFEGDRWGVASWPVRGTVAVADLTPAQLERLKLA